MTCQLPEKVYGSSLVQHIGPGIPLMACCSCFYVVIYLAFWL
jgi:hypothetical protein